MYVRLTEGEGKRKREQALKRWGWGPKPRARGLSRIHSRLIFGYCCLKPGTKNRIKTKRPLSYVHNNIYGHMTLQKTIK